MDFKDKIKINREKLGYTLEELSKLVGVSAPTIQRYESGEIKNVRRDKIAKLAEALKVSPSYLMGWEDENKDPILENIPGIITPVQMKRIPILGTIACGDPIFAQENYDGYFMIDKNLPEADFILRAKGDSMIEAHIFDGDLVFLRKTSDVDDGQIAAVLIDDEATLKRVCRDKDTVILQPCNKEYKPIIVQGNDNKQVLILGEMVGVYSKRSS